LSGLAFLSRKVATAFPERASTMNWNPPKPLIATIFPARKASQAPFRAFSFMANSAPE